MKQSRRLRTNIRTNSFKKSKLSRCLIELPDIVLPVSKTKKCNQGSTLRLMLKSKSWNLAIKHNSNAFKDFFGFCVRVLLAVWENFVWSRRFRDKKNNRFEPTTELLETITSLLPKDTQFQSHGPNFVTKELQQLKINQSKIVILEKKIQLRSKKLQAD